MRSRSMRMRSFFTGIAVWALLVSPAFAATAAKSSSSPNGIFLIWNDAINGLSALINLLAQHVVGDYGIALIIVTFLIRLATMPLMMKSLRNAKRMQSLQPMTEEIKKKHSGDPRKYQTEVMELYKREGVNPLAGCMPMILQMVILTILYRSIYTDHSLLTAKFLGILPLGQPDHTFILPVLAAVTSYLQQKVSTVSVDQSMKMMLYIFPVMIFIFSMRVFAALSLYWVFSNLFTIAQMYFIRVKPTAPEA